MSILSDKTEYKALINIANLVKRFEDFHLLQMTRLDDEDLTKARNLLQTIVHSNGYKVNYDKNSKKNPLIKNIQNEY